MATLEENIAQAIADFDDIESAIEEQGVDVPYGTDTKEYGNLIRGISGGAADQTYDPTSVKAQSGIAVAEALAGLPIQYVESPDASGETVYLRSLDSGTYVLKGAFKPYEGNSTVCRFSSNLLVNVVKGTLQGVPTSHIQIFYPVHNVVQFVEVTDSSYKRTDVKLNGLAKMETVEEMISAAANVYSNAIKATASGEVVRVDDVSPVEHTASVMVYGKNLWDMSKLDNTALFTVNGDGTVTVNGGAYYCTTNKRLREICPQLREGDTVKLTIETTGVKYIYLALAKHVFHHNTALVITKDHLDSVVCIYGVDDKDATYNEPHTISHIQLEHGEEATEYEPYIDPATVKLTRCGKNLFDVANYTVSVGNLLTNEADGDKYTVQGDVGSATLAYSAGALTVRFPDNIKADGGITISMYLTLLEQGAYDNRLRVWGMSESGANEHSTVTLTKGVRQKIACTYTSGVGEMTGVMFYLNNNKLLLEVDTLQVELNDTATAYEPYNAVSYTPAADGSVEIATLSPTMTLLTDTSGANIEVEYNQDANKAMENVKSDIRSLDAAVAELASGGAISQGKVSLVDAVTGKSYRLYVSNGKLMLAEGEG